jgi:UDP-hydrolysing UDP-N-acetyl-D-glucosamine 2-epimerase
VIKICLPIFNRATYSRCKSLIEEISKTEGYALTVVLSHALLEEKYGNAQEYIRESHPRARFIPLHLQSAEKNAVAQASAISEGLGRILHDVGFDACIVVADRFETLPAAMAAAYQNIPLIHIQGGEVTGNIDEKVRHAVTKLSDYHFVATDLAKDYVIAMGEDRTRVFKSGCPSLDVVLNANIKRKLGKEKYILSIFHPETERIDEAYQQTAIVLQATLEYCLKYQHRCYWYYPNPDPGREEVIRLLDQALDQNPDVFIRAVNLPPEEFLTQLAGARLVIGNSSCGLRECSYLGVPSVNVGARQNLRERSWNVLDSGYNHEALLEALNHQHGMERYAKSFLFGDGRSAQYIVRQMKKTEFTLKGSLTYPTLSEFRDQHLGEMRFHDHKKKYRYRPSQPESASAV